MSEPPTESHPSQAPSAPLHDQATVPDQPGQGLAENRVSVPGFEVLGVLGSGGMGVVLRARDLALGRSLAVKILLSKAGDNTQQEQRFLGEALVMGQLQHPGVPAIHQLGHLADGRPFFSMKLVRGQTLAQLLAQRRTPADDLPRFLGIFAQVCQTLGYAHSRGILHRDLKPANIMVGAFGEVQVMDWGLAKVLDRPGAPDEDSQPASGIFTLRRPGEGLSQPGMVAGTLAYMAPEQARGEVESLDERADVFGLGALLCVILTGQPPYQGNQESLHWWAMLGELTEAFARLHASGADAELLALARDCLASEREGRPRDAGVVAERITAYQRGVEERLRQAEMAQVRAREESKRRRVQLLLAVAVLLVVLVGGGAAWLFQQQRQAADAAAGQSMARARLLLEQAQTAPVFEMVRYEQALAEAHQAEQLGRTGGASAAVRRQTAELVERLTREKEAAQKDQRLLADLLEGLGPYKGPIFKKDERSLITEMAEPSADDQFASAFRAWGLDVDRTPVEAAAARLKERPASVLMEVIAALDEWAGHQRRQGLPAARWQHVTDLAQALDAADSKRRELRAILARDNLPLERALGMLGMALRPVPIPFDGGVGQDRGRLRQLAAQTDVDREPVLGLVTLVQALRVAGEEAQAERLLRGALQARPREVVLHHNLGRLLQSQTPPRWDRVVECYVAVRLLRPDLGEALALALVQARRGEEGLALYERLAADNPSNPWLHYRRSYALGRQGRSREAEAACREAIRLQPNFPLAHFNLGVALRSQGQAREAEAAFREAVRLKPDFAWAHYNLGSALRALGRYRDAEAECRQAILHQPDYAEAHCGLGNALHGQRRYKEAEAEHREAIRLQPAIPEAHDGLGTALWSQGRHKEAEAAHREAIRLQPDLPGVHINLGSALGSQGRHKEAEAEFREAIRLQSDDPLAHANLGFALNHQGRFAQSLDAFRRSHAQGSKLSDWRYPSDQWVRDAQRLAELEAKLSTILAGEAKPANAAERLELASLCQHRAKRLHAAAARFAAEAFAAEPKLADDLNRQSRYSAAGSAALAAAGQAEDAGKLTDKEKAALRQQALGWLSADLTLYGQQAQRDEPKVKQLVFARLLHWQSDTNLASVRDREALDHLPEGERDAWQKLWADVTALRRRVEARSPK
jgi:serine/threonine-protein kinase